MRPAQQRRPDFLDRLAKPLAGLHIIVTTGDFVTIAKAAGQVCQHGTYNASRAILATRAWTSRLGRLL